MSKKEVITRVSIEREKKEATFRGKGTIFQSITFVGRKEYPQGSKGQQGHSTSETLLPEKHCRGRHKERANPNCFFWLH